MNIHPSSTYHLWRPELFPLVQQAIAQKSLVGISCHYRLDECNSADLELQGRFLKLTGQQAQFVTENFDFGSGHASVPYPECEYSFSVSIPRSDSGRTLIEYGGKAIVLDQELGRNNIPLGLLLRMGLPTRVRPKRSHKRRKCPELVLMPGLMLIDSAPLNRRRLLDALAHYYQQRDRPRPSLVDISAGGVCLETEDQHCLRFMGTDSQFLFFFFTGDGSRLECPHVFLAKKVGIFRSGQARPAGLRLRFLKELLWDHPLHELRWTDIEDSGSETIRGLVAASSEKKKQPPSEGIEAR